jgi:hypothetical protein
MADRQIYDEDNNNDDCQDNKLDFEVLEPHLASQLLSLSLKVISLRFEIFCLVNQKFNLFPTIKNLYKDSQCNSYQLAIVQPKLML